MMQMHNKMMHMHLFLLLGVAGCLGETLPQNDDAAYGKQPDLSPLCTGNNDGVIDRGELQFPLGLTVRYLANPAGTTVTVAPDGVMRPSGPEWDLSSTAGEVHELTLQPLEGRW